jgi:hypothetical protein
MWRTIPRFDRSIRRNCGCAFSEIALVGVNAQSDSLVWARAGNFTTWMAKLDNCSIR